MASKVGSNHCTHAEGQETHADNRRREQIDVCETERKHHQTNIHGKYSDADSDTHNDHADVAEEKKRRPRFGRALPTEHGEQNKIRLIDESTGKNVETYARFSFGSVSGKMKMPERVASPPYAAMK